MPYFDLDECFEPAFECERCEWCEWCDLAGRLPTWLIESSGVTFDRTSKSITLSGSGTSRAEEYDLTWLGAAL
jgi:hypothetical protein